MKAITVPKIINPGQMARVGVVHIKTCALVNIFPQLAMGGWMPRPRKLRTDSIKMIFPIERVVATVIGEIEFGRMWRTIMCGADAPSATAARTNCWFFKESVS